MLPFEDRYTRQRQLREVGLAGQQRLQASLAVLGTTRADVVAGDYLQRAGVKVQLRPVTEPTTPPAAGSPSEAGVHQLPVTSHETICTFEGPSEYLRGSLTALHYLRRILGVGERPGPSSEEPNVNPSTVTVC